MKSEKIHSGHIETAVARLLNFRVYTIVPNVSFGLGLRHECDMLALDSKNRFTEIEIKVSLADLKKDFLKPHGHRSDIISRLVYAMPEDLCKKHSNLIPNSCGIIAVTAEEKHGSKIYVAEWVRQCKHKVVKEPTPKQILKFMNLGCMRIWSLKEVIRRN